jgi:hypothetical protein
VDEPGAFDSRFTCAHGSTPEASSRLATTRHRIFGSSGWLQIGDAHAPQKWRTDPRGVRYCAAVADPDDQRNADRGTIAIVVNAAPWT